MDTTVDSVAVRLPKTHGPAVTVAQARAALDEDDHIHMLLVTDAGRLLGTLVREDLPSSSEDSCLALDYAVLQGRTIAPGTSAEHARQLLCARGERRRALVDDEGELLGLLCLKRSQTGFCSDDDVRARAASRVGATGRETDAPCSDRSSGR